MKKKTNEQIIKEVENKDRIDIKAVVHHNDNVGFFMGRMFAWLLLILFILGAIGLIKLLLKWIFGG